MIKHDINLNSCFFHFHLKFKFFDFFFGNTKSWKSYKPNTNKQAQHNIRKVIVYLLLFITSPGRRWYLLYCLLYEYTIYAYLPPGDCIYMYMKIMNQEIGVEFCCFSSGIVLFFGITEKNKNNKSLKALCIMFIYLYSSSLISYFFVCFPFEFTIYFQILHRLCSILTPILIHNIFIRHI